MPRKVNSAAQSVPAQSQIEFPGMDPEKRPLWSEVDATVLKAFVGAYTDIGCGVLFGSTKDGSALNLCIYIGSEKQNYVYGLSQAAENALREYTEWAIDKRISGISFHL